MRRGVFFLPFLLMMAACKPRIPSGVISRGKMEKILYDYHLAQSLADQSDSAEVRRYAYVLAVFKKHGVTEAEFDSSMVWYCAHSYELRDIYTHLNERFEIEAEAAGASVDEFGGFTADGGTVSLWHAGAFFHMQPTHTSRMLHVVVAGDSTCHLGDEYLWRFNANFIQREGNRNAIATLVLRHDGDSVVTTSRTMRSDGRVEMHLRQADTIFLRQVDCYIYMPDAQDNAQQQGSLLITEPMLVRLRRK